MTTEPTTMQRGSGEPSAGAASPRGWSALGQLLKPRASRAQAVVAVLCAVLGFAFVTSVHTNRTPTGLAAARQEDLVRILDGLNQQSQRLSAQRERLESTVAQLSSARDTTRAALEEAQRQEAALGVLTGTVVAHGPGIEVTIDDPSGQVGPATLLDAVEELRDAGAEALQVNNVRVVASTYFTGDPGAIDVSGTPISAPYRLLAIGDPHTMTEALRIPGGVVDSVASLGEAKATIASPAVVQVTALQPLQKPRYARPAPSTSAGSGP